MTMLRNDHRREAFEEYFGITPGVASTVVYRMLSRTQGLNPADVEDITQETILTMVQKCGQPDREVIHNGRAWALRVARFRRQDFWRKKGRQPDLMEDMDDAAGRGLHSDDTPKAVDRETLALAQKVIEGLTPKLRVVADMLFDPQELSFDALPQKLVADKLGIPLGTVKSRLNKIKKHFKAVLSESPTSANLADSRRSRFSAGNNADSTIQDTPKHQDGSDAPAASESDFR